MTILFCLGSLVLGALLIYIILRPKIKQTKVYDLEIEQLNNQLKTDKELLIKQKNQLSQENTELQITLSSLNARKEEIKNSISELEKQAKESGEVFYKSSMEVAQMNLEQALNKASDDYQKANNIYQDEYLNIMRDCTQSFAAEIAIKKQELEKLEIQIANATKEVKAFIEVNKRAEEIRNKANFYKLVIPEEDMIEIKQLRDVEKCLRNPEPLNKIIWKCYYEKPYTDLVGRVIGQGIHTGIYKITNLENNMCYVGQAVKLADEKLFLVAARGRISG